MEKNKHNNSIRVLCVDDHPVVRDGLGALIGLQWDMVVAGEASNALEAVEASRRLRPDVILMDIHLPDRSGIVATQLICDAIPDSKVIVLTSYLSEEQVRGAIDAGVRGYLLKESLRTELLDAIRLVHQGSRYIPDRVSSCLSQSRSREPITSRELQVLSLVAKGYRNRTISDALSITEETVKVHIRHLLPKLNAGDRMQAVLAALRRGLVHLD